MYLDYFGLTEKPFSIAPDPAYLFMSARHKEAMAHLSYGLSQGGCFIVLTGEVGTGKTTLCRNLLSDLPANTDVALILNANVGEDELLQTICDELKVIYRQDASQKQLLDAINQHLLSTFAQNRQTVLIIDEAQLLSRGVLEQIRLLTNLETTKHKLLQIMLIGQPELNQLLTRNDLRQLAQRITARYHLGEIKASEIEDYVNHRLSVAGCRQPLFSRQALKYLHSLSEGIPRKINVLADHSLLSAYAASQSSVDSSNVKAAARDVFIQRDQPTKTSNFKLWLPLAAAMLVLVNGLVWWWFVGSQTTPQPDFADTQNQQLEAPLSPPDVSLAASASEITSAGQIADARQVEPNSAGADEQLQVAPPEPEATLAQTEDDLLPTADDDLSIDQDDSSSVAALVPINTNPNELTTIVKSPDIQPGSVMISDELLDDTPPQAAAITQSQVPLYDLNSEFGKALDASSDVTGRTLAFRSLAQAWDVTLPTPLISSACGALEKQRIACLEVVTWRQLERFNRPSILVLRQGDQLHRVIVFALEGQSAKVLIGDDVHEVSQSELRARWNNNGITFWRPGQSGQRLLKINDNDNQVPIIRTRLNQVFSALNMPLLERESLSVFDADMSQKIFALQSLFGISTDSVIGPETYLLMNELLQGDQTPVLRDRVKRG